MRNAIRAALVIALSSGLAHPAAAAGKRTSEVFDDSGVIVDVHRFFTAAARNAGDKALEVAHKSTAGYALVTEQGVFAFLETPQNEKALAEAEHGSVVRLRGKLLKEGALLHVNELEYVTKVPLIDFARFRNDEGRAVELEGVNKCQCGLDVADLPHSCKLGHLHHLEATDGKIYNYLQFARGREVFVMGDAHFKPVRLTARALPGNFLVVDEVQIAEASE